ncbi:DRTGG domain-containing protein [Paramaledivibacter caminithermalis]|jgi:predicted transcriptional regulator|uniref:DRTGG domain-containing protein n=1 Tax=Paramaledivibacter caminithermalis (strain DSM 15212 / CIP 107654 / DViRD3) TaxID=1121301 RepID=A0A1M6MEQ6_PARC5|nr:DRTGG domain-containing protein [Paramaledivibacter caminithermalis]SHJ81833.1 DRTGG domain-containing protein [Paramaledivibacter caminithermalis DSM 15212]
MLIKDVKELLDGEFLTGQEYSMCEVNGAFGCDLMSDVLAYVEDKTLLLTGLTNPQVIRTAEMLDINAIVFVRGKVPSEEVIAMAKDIGIALIATKHTMYTSCGILYNNGLKGILIGGI